MRLVWRLPDVAATEQFGAMLARTLEWSDAEPRVLFLCGELGAGKTTLAAALLQAAGVLDAVRSPTFSLLELYEVSGGQAVHVDLYRLGDPGELEHLALRDYLAARTLLLVEWPQRGIGMLPSPDLQVQLLTVPCRVAGIEALSVAGNAWLERLRGGLPPDIETEN